MDQKLEHEHDERTKVKNVGVIECGRYEVDAWYYSPFPGEYGDGTCAKLYVCEHCLKYMKKQRTLLKHKHRCTLTHPPGKQIYRHPQPETGKPTLAFWEIDGKNFKVYCQNLCLLAKLFLAGSRVRNNTSTRHVTRCHYASPPIACSLSAKPCTS